MPDRTRNAGAPRGSGGEVRGAFASTGAPPFATEWRDERDLCVRPDGSLDEAAKRRLREWRQKGLTWNRYGTDGRIQVACDPTQRDRPWRVGDSATSAKAASISPLMQRHIELETRLRTGPHLEDGSYDDPILMFPVTAVEFRELIDLRQLHACGAEWGDGEMRAYWRPLCDDNIVGEGRNVISRYVLWGRERLRR